jgi:hypothetical protein
LRAGGGNPKLQKSGVVTTTTENTDVGRASGMLSA